MKVLATMKTFFLSWRFSGMAKRLSNFLVLALATSVSLSSAPAFSAPGDDLSIINPLHWLGADSIERQSKLAAQAKRNADLAEREADHLEQQAGTLTAQARKAREHAEKARAAANTLAESVDEKKQREEYWDAANKSKPTPVVKEPTNNTNKVSTTADKQEIGYLPENNANSPNSMDGQSQSDAMTRMHTPDSLKDSMPGTRSDDIVRDAEKENAAKGNPKAKENTEKSKGTTSPWNPMGWFNGNNHSVNHAKAPQDDKTTTDTKTDSQNSTVMPTNIPQSESPNPSAGPATDGRVKPQKGKRAPLKAPQLMFKSLRKPSSKTEQADSQVAGEAIATSAIAGETSAASSIPATKEAVEQKAPVEKAQAAILETEKGAISIELFPKQAPNTVENFATLANEGFYNRGNMKFHRVIPGFVIQTGDPTGTGAGGSKKTIPLEAKNKLSHNTKGMVAMARGGDPDSASSQFYITLAPQTALDGKYAIFGKVVGGLDVLDKITKDDQLYAVRVVDPKELTHDPVTKKNLFSAIKPSHKQQAKQ
jgi:peptidyl-prolyl cis-trans isomerase B (cyclophilin B)